MRKILVAIVVALVASTAVAVPLDLNNQYGVAALVTVYNTDLVVLVYAVMTDGNSYFTWYPYGSEFAWRPFNPSPVPLEQVADWTPAFLYTFDGRCFTRQHVREIGSPFENPWIQIAPPPGFMPVGSNSSTLGGVKSLYR